MEIEKKKFGSFNNTDWDRSSNLELLFLFVVMIKIWMAEWLFLRKADQQNNLIQYHSDIRSSKIEKIKKNPNCSLLFYGKEEKIQLRIKAKCEVNYNNQVTKVSWEKTGHISRKCYFS